MDKLYVESVTRKLSNVNNFSSMKICIKSNKCHVQVLSNITNRHWLLQKQIYFPLLWNI